MMFYYLAIWILGFAAGYIVGIAKEDAWKD